MVATPEVLPAGDIGIIAAALREPAVEFQLHAVVLRAAELARVHRGRLSSLNQTEFEVFIDSYQCCVKELQRITSYAELAVDSGLLAAEGTAALARCDGAWSELADVLGFVEPELAALPATVVGGHRVLAAGGALHNFYRKVSASSSPDDKVAAVLAATQPSSTDGWRALARQLLSRITVVTPDGVAGVGSTLPKLYEPDPAVRRQAQRDITEALAGELELRSTALSMIVLDGLTRAELTGGSWLDEALVADDLTRAEVDALVAGAAAGYPIVHDYYQLKANLLGESRLDETDRYAPIGNDGGHISWARAVETVLATFDAVHPRCGAVARQLFGSNRIDATGRPGKAVGPFTKDVPGELPWISVNFNGSLRHVLLLAHELGHGVHMRLSGELPLLAASTPRVLAETVALFFESATLAHLERTQPPSAAVAGLVARWIEDQAVTICRHAAIFRFEAGLRQRMQTVGRLDTGAINELWLATQRELYAGDGIALSDSFASWWSYLDSIYLSPGSSYAYMYGQFAAAALTEQRATGAAEFGDRLLALMAAGGSAPPRELLRRTGVDPLAPATWQAALSALGKRVTALRHMMAEAGRTAASVGY